MTTPEIAHDASAAEVKDLLETLPSLGQVLGAQLLVGIYPVCSFSQYLCFFYFAFIIS